MRDERGAGANALTLLLSLLAVGATSCSTWSSSKPDRLPPGERPPDPRCHMPDRSDTPERIDPATEPWVCDVEWREECEAIKRQPTNRRIVCLSPAGSEVLPVLAIAQDPDPRCSPSANGGCVCRVELPDDCRTITKACSGSSRSVCVNALTPRLSTIEAETVATPAVAASDCSIDAVLTTIADEGVPRAASVPGIRESKAVRNRVRLCLAGRYAECQAKLDHLGTAAAQTCWTNLPKNPLVDASVPRCLSAFNDEVAAVKTCIRLPETTETELEAKAKCLGMPPRKSVAPNNTESPFKRNTCGPLSLDPVIAAAEQSTNLTTRRTDLRRKLEPFRQRRNATDAACGDVHMLDMQYRLLKEQKDIEREGGVVDLEARRRIGQMIVITKKSMSNTLRNFKKVHGRVFDSKRDCRQ
jgi:hypothetical protein